MKTFACPYLGGEVELSTSGRATSLKRTRSYSRVYVDQISDTLRDPDQVREADASRIHGCFEIGYGEYSKENIWLWMVVSEAPPKSRDWVVTAYITRQFWKETWNGSEANV